MNSILQHGNELSVEAKRVTITRDIERLANRMLSDIHINNIANAPYESQKTCRQVLPWNDHEFWKDLPTPSVNNKNIQSNSIEDHSAQLYKPVKCKRKLPQGNNNVIKRKTTPILLEKFFNKWKLHARRAKERKQKLDQINQNEKLDNCLKLLKEHKNAKPKSCENTKIKKETNESLNKRAISKSACYQHRFKAQQDIIISQKEKLLQQEKLIQELRLGKLSQEINRSIEETQKEIRETFTKSSFKVKCNARPSIENNEETVLKFHVNTSKAPKIVQEMEKRALEREEKRQITLERKRLMDIAKKQAIEMEIGKKRALDEEEKKRCLREIKEQRRKQLEVQQKIQMKKDAFLKNCLKADKFYNRKLLTLGFKGFLRLIIAKENSIFKSEEFYVTHLKRTCWIEWSNFISKINERKIMAVIHFYNLKLKKKILKLWFKAYNVSVQHIQVAEDLHEMRLQNRVFVHWHRYVCVQYIVQHKNVQKAHKHYQSRLLLHYFYQWKLLPVVLQLEKAKEEKKRKWREKVWEILPDYNPVVDN